jgi:hypothetical protein
VSVIATALIAAAVLVPGFGAVLALFPRGSVSVPSALALSLGLGYALTALPATVLAIAGVLVPASAVAVMIVVSAAVWAIALRRHGPRARLRAVRMRGWRGRTRDLAGLAVVAVYAVLHYSRYSPLLNFDVAAAWRYWADGAIVGHTGGIPAQTVGWGSTYPTTVSKAALSSTIGTVGFFTGPLHGLGAMLWLSAVGGVVAVWALAAELGLGLVAPLVPVLLIVTPGWLPLNHEMTADLTAFTAEDIGRMLAASALLLAVIALRSGSRVKAVAAGVILLACAATHLVPMAIAAGLLVCYAAVHGASRRRLRGTIVIVAIVGATTVVGWGGIVVGSGGHLGFQGVRASSGSTGFPPAYDPSASFIVGHPVIHPARTSRGHYYLPGTVVRWFFASAAGSAAIVPTRRDYAIVALAAAAALALLILPRTGLRPIGAMALGLGVMILVVALLFNDRYTTRVPADFGVHRLYDYDAIPVVLAAAAVAELGARGLGRLHRHARPALIVVAAIAAVAVAWPVRPPVAAAEAGRAQSLYATVRATVPCTARILPDARTAGSFAALTGRRSVIEGMAPYLNPALMKRVLPVLLGAREFFRKPAQNRGYLARERVDFVLLLTDPTVRIGQSGGRVDQGADFAAVRALPDLRLVRRRRAFELYAVGGARTRPPGAHRRACYAALR